MPPTPSSDQGLGCSVFMFEIGGLRFEALVVIAVVAVAVSVVAAVVASSNDSPTFKPEAWTWCDCPRLGPGGPSKD